MQLSTLQCKDCSAHCNWFFDDHLLIDVLVLYAFDDLLIDVLVLYAVDDLLIDVLVLYAVEIRCCS